MKIEGLCISGQTGSNIVGIDASGNTTSATLTTLLEETIVLRERDMEAFEDKQYKDIEMYRRRTGRKYPQLYTIEIEVKTVPLSSDECAARWEALLNKPEFADLSKAIDEAVDIYESAMTWEEKYNEIFTCGIEKQLIDCSDLDWEEPEGDCEQIVKSFMTAVLKLKDDLSETGAIE